MIPGRTVTPSGLLLRYDEDDRAPPNRTTGDLDGGTAVVRMPITARRRRPA